MAFERPGGHRAPCPTDLPPPTIGCSPPQFTCPNRSRRSSELSKTSPTSNPPLSLSTYTGLSEVDDSAHKKEKNPASGPVLQNVFPSPSILPRPSAVELRGLDSGHQQPTDFYQPVIRKSPERGLSTLDSLNRLEQTPAIALIDTITTWKGLSLSHCEDLMLIQKNVTNSLQRLLEDQFISFKARLRSDARPSLQDSWATPELFETVIPCRFRFDRDQVIRAVLKKLGINDFNDNEASEQLLMLYLWSRDCFLYLPGGSGATVINACYRCYMDAGACCPSSSALGTVWAPDYLAFEGLNVLSPEGSSITIKPHYRMGAPQGLKDPLTLVTYSLESNHQWLRWDENAGAFRGHVPHFSEDPGLSTRLGQARRHGRQGSHNAIHVLGVEIKALVVVTYPDFAVCIERTVRTRVSLKVAPAAYRSSQAHNPCRHSTRFMDGLVSQVQRRPTGCQHRDGHYEADNLPAYAPTVAKSNAILLARHTAAWEVEATAAGPSTKESRFQAPPLSTDMGGWKSLPDKYSAGKMECPKSQELPSGSKEKLSPTPRVLSKTLGIELKTLEPIRVSPYEPIVTEGTPCDTVDVARTDSTAITKYSDKKCDESDARWTRDRAKQRTTSRCWVGATSPSANDRPEEQISRSGSPQIRRSRPCIRTPCTPQTAFRVHNYAYLSGTNWSAAEAPDATKRTIRSAQVVHLSKKCRQERSSRTSELGRLSLPTKDLVGIGAGHYSKRQATIRRLPLSEISSPNSRACPPSSSLAAHKDHMPDDIRSTTSNSTPTSTPKRKSYQVLQSSEAIKNTQRKLTSSNRSSPLQDLSEDSDHAPSETTGDSELSCSVGAQDWSQLNKHTDRRFFREGSACFLEKVFQGLVPRDPLPPQQGHVCSSPVEGLYTASGCSTEHGSSMRPPSPTFDGDGGDPTTAEEKRAALRISTTKEAIEACREPGLSDHERSQMFEALKRSLPEELLTSEAAKRFKTTNLFWDDDPFIEVDAETAKGSTTESERNSAEELGEDSDEDLNDGLVGGAYQDLRDDGVCVLSAGWLTEEESCF